jgi:hypothetical protein
VVAQSGASEVLEVPPGIAGTGPEGYAVVVASETEVLGLGGVDPTTIGTDRPVLRREALLVDQETGAGRTVPYPRVDGHLVNLQGAAGTADGFIAVGTVCAAEVVDEDGAGCGRGRPALVMLEAGSDRWTLDERGRALQEIDLASVWHLDVGPRGEVALGIGAHREDGFAFQTVLIDSDGGAVRADAPEDVSQACLTDSAFYVLSRSTSDADPEASTTTFELHRLSLEDGRSTQVVLPALDGQFGGVSVRLACTADAPVLTSSPASGTEHLYLAAGSGWTEVDGVFTEPGVQLATDLLGGPRGVVLQTTALDPADGSSSSVTRSVRVPDGETTALDLPADSRLVLTPDGTRAIAVSGPDDAESTGGDPSPGAMRIVEVPS